MIGAAGATATCHAAAEDVVNFKLLRGDTPGTIEEFQRQSHVVISFNPEVHVTTNAVHGRQSIAAAVREFLRGTGLKAVFLPTGELAIELVVRTGRVQPQSVGPPRAAAVSSTAEPERMPEITVETGTWVKRGEAVVRTRSPARPLRSSNPVRRQHPSSFNFKLLLSARAQPRTRIMTAWRERHTQAWRPR
jgi:hypothetical protein